MLIRIENLSKNESYWVEKVLIKSGIDTDDNRASLVPANEDAEMNVG